MGTRAGNSIDSYWKYITIKTQKKDQPKTISVGFPSRYIVLYSMPHSLPPMHLSILYLSYFRKGRGSSGLVKSAVAQ